MTDKNRLRKISRNVRAKVSKWTEPVPKGSGKANVNKRGASVDVCGSDWKEYAERNTLANLTSVRNGEDERRERRDAVSASSANRIS